MSVRLAAVATILIASALSSGCLVGSLHPFFDAATMVSQPLLQGTWVSEDEDVTIVIEAGEWRSYRLAFTDRAGTQSFTAHATRVGAREFVDILPAAGYQRGELIVPLHALFLVDVKEDSLTARILNYDWFERAKKGGRLTAVGGVFDAKQNVVLTESTTSLRTFLRTAPDEMFGPPARLVRKK